MANARTMSNWEYSLVLAQAKAMIRKHVRKIYQTGESEIRIDIGKETLMVRPGVCFYLAQTPPPGPAEPGNLAMLLRKHLEGKLLESFEAYQNDRIFIMGFSDGVKLVLEQFGKGNLILRSADGKIIRALHKVEGIELEKKGGKRESLQEWLERALGAPNGSLALAVALARGPVGKIYAREAAALSGLDEKMKVAQLKGEDAARLARAFHAMMDDVSPRVYWKKKEGAKEKEPAEVSLAPLSGYETAEFERQEFSSWSQALEAYFSNLKEDKKEVQDSPQMIRLKKRLEGQEEALAGLEREIGEWAKKTRWMQENLDLIQQKIDEANRRKERRIELEMDG